MEQFVILVVVAVVLAGRNLWLKFKKRTEERDASPTTGPVTSASGQSRGRTATEQDEKMRKFFEALGLPTDALPPPPVMPRQESPPLMPQTAALPRKPMPRRTAQPPPLTGSPTSIHVPLGSLAGPRAATPAEVYASTQIAAPTARPITQREFSPGAAIAFDLRSSPQILRRAVVINELLGKPLGLR